MESTRQNNNINAINNARMLLNELRSNLSREETKRVRDKLYEKEAIYNFLKEKDSLTNKEKKVLMNIGRYPKNITKHLKSLKNHFKKSQKYQYGLDYLFNEHNEEGHTKKLCRIEAVYNVLKDKEKKGSLTSRQKNMLLNDERYLKNISKHLKNLKKHFKKTQYDIDLMNH